MTPPSESENKSLIKSKIELDKVIGLILSMLFGLVYKEIIISFNRMVQGINYYEGFPFSYEICAFSIAVFCLNVFRMLHGYILSIYDQRNPTSIGPYPYSAKELFMLMITFIVPLISMYYFTNLKEHYSPIVFVIAFQGPLFIYVIWDLSMLNELSYLRIEAKEKGFILETNGFDSFIRRWIVFDVIHVCLTLAFFLLHHHNLFTVNYYLSVFMISLINLIIIFCDYIWYNREFYFPSSSKSK